MAGNGKKPMPPTSRELRLAEAIGRAVHETLAPEIRELRTEVRELRTDHGAKLDQLIAGSVGVGRMTALEQNVAELRRDLDELKRERH